MRHAWRSALPSARVSHVYMDFHVHSQATHGRMARRAHRRVEGDKETRTQTRPTRCELLRMHHPVSTPRKKGTGLQKTAPRVRKHSRRGQHHRKLQTVSRFQFYSHYAAAVAQKSQLASRGARACIAAGVSHNARTHRTSLALFQTCASPQLAACKHLSSLNLARIAPNDNTAAYHTVP